MSRRFTVLTVMLTAVVAFLVGAIFAGSGTRSAVLSGSPKASARPATVAASAAATVSPLVSFAEVVEHINPAVVNIDATSRVPDRRRRGRSLAPEPPDMFSNPFDFGGRGERDPTRRGAGSGF